MRPAQGPKLLQDSLLRPLLRSQSSCSLRLRLGSGTYQGPLKSIVMQRLRVALRVLHMRL